MEDFDLGSRRPLQLGLATRTATGTAVDWVMPGDPVRVRGSDLGQAARRASAARLDNPGSDVVVDIEFVIAADSQSARALASAACESPGDQTLLYVGTPNGLAGLIADIYTIGIADGAVLIPLAGEGNTLFRTAVLPVLETMTRMLTPVAGSHTA